MNDTNLASLQEFSDKHTVVKPQTMVAASTRRQIFS